MKDILITSARLKKELRILFYCFVLSFLINISAIIMYKTPWFEAFTQIGYVIAITLILYFIVSLFRIFFIFIKKLFNRKPKQADKNIVKPID